MKNTFHAKCIGNLHIQVWGQSAWLHLFDEKYSKNCKKEIIYKIVLQFKINVFYEYIAKCNFYSIISPVFSDPSEITLICWFAAQETSLIIINVENSWASSYFFGNCDIFSFLGFFDE